MSSPTDREFQRVIDQLDDIGKKVDSLVEREAQRRGSEAVMRWLVGSGGLVAWLGGIAALFATFVHGRASH